jgi:hypothetical protein
MNTPHKLDHYSALDHSIGRRVTKSFGGWLEICEQHDSWHELPEDKQQPTLENVAAFLDDYRDFREETYEQPLHNYEAEREYNDAEDINDMNPMRGFWGKGEY